MQGKDVELSVPDLILEGHTDNAQFALGCSTAEPLVASGGQDTNVGPAHNAIPSSPAIAAQWSFVHGRFQNLAQNGALLEGISDRCSSQAANRSKADAYPLGKDCLSVGHGHR